MQKGIRLQRKVWKIMKKMHMQNRLKRTRNVRRHYEQKDVYDVLLAKVQAIREKNLLPEKWMLTELNTMMQW